MEAEANTIRVIQCHDFDHLTALVRAPHCGVPTIFRGQEDVTWPLSSMWERRLRFYRNGWHPLGTKPFPGEHPDKNLDELFGPEGQANRNRFRDVFFQRFRELVIGLPGVSSEVFTDKNYQKQAWALGRHHGLVTPLLDWTYSPFIALFFASFDYAESHNPGLKSGLRGAGGYINFNDPKPIAVWELGLPATIAIEDEFEFFESRVDQAHRQKAQQGVFTFLNHRRFLDIESYFHSRDLANYLTRYELPGTEVGKALWNLRLMNITYGTLFPDLEGAAIEANAAQALMVTERFYPPQEELLADKTRGQPAGIQVLPRPVGPGRGLFNVEMAIHGGQALRVWHNHELKWFYDIDHTSPQSVTFDFENGFDFEKEREKAKSQAHQAFHQGQPCKERLDWTLDESTKTKVLGRMGEA